jgi:hypothetical protein
MVALSIFVHLTKALSGLLQLALGGVNGNVDVYHQEEDFFHRLIS